MWRGGWCKILGRIAAFGTNTCHGVPKDFVHSVAVVSRVSQRIATAAIFADSVHIDVWMTVVVGEND
jgi:hypothetical protein